MFKLVTPEKHSVGVKACFLQPQVWEYRGSVYFLNEGSTEQWFLLGVESTSEQDLWTPQRNVSVPDLLISLSFAIFLAEVSLGDPFQFTADGQWPQDTQWTAVLPFCAFLPFSPILSFLIATATPIIKKRHTDPLAICICDKWCDFFQVPTLSQFPSMPGEEKRVFARDSVEETHGQEFGQNGSGLPRLPARQASLTFFSSKPFHHYWVYCPTHFLFTKKLLAQTIW